MTSSVNRTEIYLQPSLYPISELVYDIKLGTYKGSKLVLIDELPLTHVTLQSDTTFLLDDGNEFIIYVGINTPPEFLYACFGIERIIEQKKLKTKVSKKSDNENSILNRLWNIFDYLRSFSTYQNLTIISESATPKELLYFKQFLYEDRSDTVMGRTEFYSYIKEQTNHNLKK
jgi:hypothetical protein